jgi:HAD superfamily hydrolase (TIGR01484 family)
MPLHATASLSSPLLSFDFDGTLHNPAEEPSVSTELFDVLQELKISRQAKWGVNTGRSLPHLLEGLEEGKFPLAPDFIVAREREVFYAYGKGGWQEDAELNDRCEHEINVLLHDSRELMAELRHVIEEHTGAEWIEQPGEPAGLIARTEAEMAWIMAQVQKRVPAGSALGWQRNSIYLRFGPRNFQKGSSLARVASTLGIARESIFAIGDSHNDLEMLDVRIAAMVACPANAVAEIKEHLRAQDGYLSTAAYSAGVCEALRNFFF